MTAIVKHGGTTLVAHKKRKHSHLQHPLNDLRYGVLAAHKELETTFKGTVHKFASEANNQDIVEFADKQAQQYLDVPLKVVEVAR